MSISYPLIDSPAPAAAPAPNASQAAIGGASAMRAWKLDPKTRERVIVGGRYVRIYGLDAIRQACQIACGVVRGEWFADLDLGVPYYERIFVKNPSEDQIRAAYRDALLAVKGVSAVESITLDFDRSARLLSVSWTVSTDLGQLSDTSEIPFQNL